MLTTILSIVGAIFIIGLIIMAHEFGHYITGRKLGFHIEEFSIGFGPKLFRWKKNGIVYAIRALPIGGYVRFLGEDEENSDPRAFNNMPKWRRLIVLLSGSVNNILMAILIAIATMLCFGEFAPVVANVNEGSPAYEAGLMANDRIIAINGESVYFYNEAPGKIVPREDGTAEIVVKRDGETVTLTSSFEYSSELNRNIIGVSIGAERVYYGFFEAIGLSLRWMIYLFQEMLSAIFKLFTFQQGLDGMVGTVGVISMLGEAVRSSFETVLRFTTLIALNLGVFNLIPFPALDGGRIAFLGIEAIIRRPVSQKIEAAVNFTGLMIVFVLIFFLTYNDIARLITGG